VVITLVCGTKILGSIPNYGPHILNFSFRMLLSSLIGLPLVGASIISFLGENSTISIRRVGLFSSGITFVVSLFLWILFDASSAD
tara:strand:- start:649 stop:903 length:255 start_codon:yes stop_codon:yes gene_type:complete